MDQLRQIPSASTLLDLATTYQRTLEQWSRLRGNRGSSNPLVTYILKDKEGDYKRLRLFYETLKQNHRYKAKFLQQQCIKSKICFWLARMSTSIEDHSYGPSDLNFQPDKITELDGVPVVQGPVTIGREDIVEINSFELREDANNDSASSDNVYHLKDTVCYASASTTILSSRPRRLSLPSRPTLFALSAAQSGFCKLTLLTSQ